MLIRELYGLNYEKVSDIFFIYLFISLFYELHENNLNMRKLRSHSD